MSIQPIVEKVKKIKINIQSTVEKIKIQKVSAFT